MQSVSTVEDEEYVEEDVEDDVDDVDVADVEDVHVEANAAARSGRT